MAIKFFDCKGFGQIEPNQVWFTRAGMSESQVQLDPEVFASNFPMTATEATDGLIYAENGAFLIVDKAKGIATVPTADLAAKGFPIGINYSTEKIYNQFTPGRKNFCMICGEFLPRIGYTDVGMRVTTNAVAWETTNAGIFTTVNTTFDSDIMYSDVKAALDAGTDVFAYLVDGSLGKLVIGADSTDALGTISAQVVKAYTNADGTKSFMFQFNNRPSV